MFKQINYRGKKPQIRALLRDRQKFKGRIRYHKSKIDLHTSKIKEIEEKTIVGIDKKLEFYLGESKK